MEQSGGIWRSIIKNAQVDQTGFFRLKFKLYILSGRQKPYLLNFECIKTPSLIKRVFL